jgi:hypothetical protein
MLVVRASPRAGSLLQGIFSEHKICSQQKSPVGAGLLAKDVNDNAHILEQRDTLEFYASKLAPTRE